MRGVISQLSWFEVYVLELVFQIQVYGNILKVHLRSKKHAQLLVQRAG